MKYAPSKLAILLLVLSPFAVSAQSVTDREVLDGLADNVRMGLESILTDPSKSSMIRMEAICALSESAPAKACLCCLKPLNRI